MEKQQNDTQSQDTSTHPEEERLYWKLMNSPEAPWEDEDEEVSVTLFYKPSKDTETISPKQENQTS